MTPSPHFLSVWFHKTARPSKGKSATKKEDVELSFDAPPVSKKTSIGKSKKQQSDVNTYYDEDEDAP